MDGRFVALSKQGLTLRGDALQDQTNMLLKVVPEREFLGDLPDGRDPAYTGPEDDDELIAMMLRSGGSAAAAFGDRATFKQLWEADAVALGKHFPDPVRPYDASSADMALQAHLAFWTGKDMPRMERLHQRSGLMREKWAKRKDYRRETVQTAARLCKNVYDRPRLPSAQSNNAGSDRTSTFFTAASLQGRPVRARDWLVPEWIPDRTVSLLSGDGGTGKSLLALQLAIAVATGSPWLGMPIRQGKVIYFSAEDDEDELHRRLADILSKNFIGFERRENLTLRSLAGEDALLANELNNALTPSNLMDELDQRAELDDPVLIVVDIVRAGNRDERAGAADQFR